MECVLAVEGGNTKTVALVAALDGTILGTGRGGCGDIYYSRAFARGMDGTALALENIEGAVSQALSVARIERGDLVASVFNMAGADWPEDFALLRSAMQERGLGRIIQVQNDALGILHTGSSDNTGVSIICGTGAATGARGPDGRVWHSSFWQGTAEGSVQLSRKTLDAVMRSELGIEPPTTLTRHVLAFFGLPTVEEVLHRLTGRNQPDLPRIDGLTPVLLDEADAGDILAQQIIREHGHALGKYGVVAARKVGIEGTAFALVLAGGVLRHPSPLLAEAIVAEVCLTSPDVKPVRTRGEPAIGVLLTALEMAGIHLNKDILAQIAMTTPPADFFATLPASSFRESIETLPYPVQP
ncbi:MAG TPA: BadF/BadG/BcrA/BcrD ATPase family protein, partial [Ktedonobacteraceae bacterium]|nr:BadF/BadG/BcrA/BcrD ATPase family protein [Ktedonobacteraceae bacterium]